MNTYTDKQNEIHQRMIDEAYKHLHNTGVKSVQTVSDSIGSCLYGGSGCAFAPMIKEGEHTVLDDSFLISDATSIYRNSPESLHDWAMGACPHFASFVQYCHDLCNMGDEFLTEFDERLKELCKCYNYTFPGDKA